MSNDFIEGDEFDPEVVQASENAVYEEKAEQDEALQAHIRRCKQAYASVFVAGNATPDDVDFVMRDLGWFCKAHGSQWDADPRMQDRNVARREVFQRITEYSSLSSDTLFRRYAETQF